MDTQLLGRMLDFYKSLEERAKDIARDTLTKEHYIYSDEVEITPTYVEVIFNTGCENCCDTNRLTVTFPTIKLFKEDL